MDLSTFLSLDFSLYFPTVGTFISTFKEPSSSHKEASLNAINAATKTEYSSSQKEAILSAINVEVPNSYTQQALSRATINTAKAKRVTKKYNHEFGDSASGNKKRRRGRLRKEIAGQAISIILVLGDNPRVRVDGKGEIMTSSLKTLFRRRCLISSRHSTIQPTRSYDIPTAILYINQQQKLKIKNKSNQKNRGNTEAREDKKLTQISPNLTMDRLLSQARSLRITTGGANPTLTPVPAGAGRGSFMLVGRMLTSRNISVSTMKGATRQPWTKAGEVDIRNEGDNIFVFTFAEERLRDIVWSKRPWVIANSFLNLKKWDGCGEPRNIPFHTAEMWIHVHSLPQIYKSLDNMKVIGNLYFRYIDCDKSGLEKGIWRRYIRMFAEVRIDEALQVFGELPTEQQEIIEFKYEKVTDYCLYCGIMGHSEGSCEAREEDMLIGRSGELTGCYEHSIRAGSAPRDIYGGLRIRNSPTPRSPIGDINDLETTETEGRGVSRGAVEPTRGLSASRASTEQGRRAETRSTNQYTEWSVDGIIAEIDKETRGEQALREGLMPRRIDLEEEIREEAADRPRRQEGVNPSNLVGQTLNCPPGFEAQILAAQTKLIRGKAILEQMETNSPNYGPYPSMVDQYDLQTAQQDHIYIPSPNEQQNAKKRKTGVLGRGLPTMEGGKFEMGGDKISSQKGTVGRKPGSRKGGKARGGHVGVEEPLEISREDGSCCGEVTTQRSPGEP
ncbi:hypothetical protein LINGRAHAP2_LOCUS32889 [Linum grandiflorum]